MADVRIDHKRICVNGESRAFLSGEMHYWRHDPSEWGSILASTKALGLDVISTDVCWGFHEIAPDQFDSFAAVSAS